MGVATDTQDATGAVVATVRGNCRSRKQIYEAAAAGSWGRSNQIPPMYSALHHQGERLYQLARRGEAVAVKPRKVTVYGWTVEEVALPRVHYDGDVLPGHLYPHPGPGPGPGPGLRGPPGGLRRLAVGAFRVEAALSLTALAELSREDLCQRIIPLSLCLPGMRPVEVGLGEARRLRPQGSSW